MLTCAAGASYAQFHEEDARLWYIRGSFGMAGQDLGAVSSALQAQKQNLVDLGFDMSTYAYDFDQIWDYRVEVGSVIWNHLALGFVFDYQPRTDTKSVGGVAPGDQFRYSEELDVNYHAFLGSLSYWWPGKHSFFIGGVAGYGVGSFKQNQSITDPSNPQFTLSAEGNYDGGSAVYGFNAGYNYAFANGGLIYLQLGYEWRDIGTLTGTTTSSNQSIVPDYSGTWRVGGEEINWDFSGPFLAIGFGFSGPY